MEHVKSIQFQYMFGDDILVAPVIRKNEESQTFYVPEGEWIYFWDNDITVTGPKDGFTIESDIGFPPAFFLKDSAFASDFEKVAEYYSRLPCNPNIPFEDTEVDALESYFNEHF